MLAGPLSAISEMRTILFVISLLFNLNVKAQPYQDTITFDEIPTEVKKSYSEGYKKNNLKFVVLRGISTYELTIDYKDINRTLGYNQVGELQYFKDECSLDTIESIEYQKLLIALKNIGFKAFKKCYCELRPNSKQQFIEIYYLNKNDELKYMPVNVTNE
jgi:hypothetical protein